MNEGKLKQRHWRPDFTGQMFIATSRSRNPTSDRLFVRSRRPDLWDSVLPKGGLPLLPETYLEKACGAPFSWERFQRSTPQTEPETDRIGGMSREVIHPHLYFHIFESLPGLNGTATNRHRIRFLINSDSQNYHRIPKKQGGVRLSCLLRI